MLHSEFQTVTWVPEISILTISEILKKTYGISKATITQLSGYDDKNFRLEKLQYSSRDGPETLVLKVSNPLEAVVKGHIEFQPLFCEALNKNGIPAPKTFPTVSGRHFSVEEVAPGIFLPVRLFHLLPGSILESFDFTPSLVQKIASVLAELHRTADEVHATTDYAPYIAAEYSSLLKNEARLLHKENFMSEGRLKMVEEGLSQYEDLKGRKLDRGIIHSDFNETNVLISDGEVTGVLDFGDCHIAPRAMDVASLILYLHLSDRLEQGIPTLAKNVLLGYRSRRSFTDSDEIVLVCMRARISCSLIYGLRTARIKGEGSDSYVLKTQGPGWKTLEELLSSRNQLI